jgi:hypothetical protein
MSISDVVRNTPLTRGARGAGTEPISEARLGPMRAGTTSVRHEGPNA